MIIGITGSSGAGKSTLCDILAQKYHAVIINADEIARSLSKKGTEYWQEIVQNFGTEILLENEEIDRKKLGKIIYINEEKRELLNKSTFYYVKKEIEKMIEQAENKIIAIDAPLLLEAELDKMCDITIAVVSRNRKIQIERIMQRDFIEEQHAIERLNAQHQDDYYIAKCSYRVINDNKIEDIEKQIASILKYF